MGNCLYDSELLYLKGKIMYVVADSYGTYQICWRWKTVLEWMRVCSPAAQVRHRLTGALLAQRIQWRTS